MPNNILHPPLSVTRVSEISEREGEREGGIF